MSHVSVAPGRNIRSAVGDNMADDKELSTDILIADVMLRLTVLENLLIKKGLLTREEVQAMTDELTQKISKAVLAKINATKNIDEFISSLKGEKKNTSSNN